MPLKRSLSSSSSIDENPSEVFLELMDFVALHQETIENSSVGIYYTPIDDLSEPIEYTPEEENCFLLTFEDYEAAMALKQIKSIDFDFCELQRIALSTIVEEQDEEDRVVYDISKRHKVQDEVMYDDQLLDVIPIRILPIIVV